MMILVAEFTDGNMQLMVVKIMILLLTKVLLAVMTVNDDDNHGKYDDNDN